MTPAFVHSFSYTTAYQADPAQIFSALCAKQSDCLLLESAEISTKNSIKSLMILKTAVKITCVDDLVYIKAQSDNGVAVLQAATKALTQKATLLEQTPILSCFRFEAIDSRLDEDAKLLQASVFDGLRCVLNLYRHSQTPVVLGGLFGYDLVRQFIPTNDMVLEDELTCPDYCFYLAEQLLVIDHQQKTTTLQTFCFESGQLPVLTAQAADYLAQLVVVPTPTSPTWYDCQLQVNIDDTSFKAMVERLKKHIELGDVFQIVPSRRFSLACPKPLLAYGQLKKSNTSPYMFFMQDSDFVLFGASPESALKYDQDTRQLEVYPIAGSRPRGFDAQGQIDVDLDTRLELELRLDKKELAEHLMLVDLARNDVARVCKTGSRHVAQLMQVDRYSHVMHLVSQVVGELRPEFDALQAYQACMNMGTLTGAPKIKAMQLIYQTEGQKRGSYGGAVGYLSSKGDLDSCIVIRSAFVQNGVAHVQAGCGVVLDSVPQMESDETRHKANAVIQAILHSNGQ